MKATLQKLLATSSACILLSNCTHKTTVQPSFQQLTHNSEKIEGKAKYLNSPFVTAGDRLYMVGHQNGQFPDLGWHVTGEMGGIWDHPIKLMDGFTANIVVNQKSICLSEAQGFTNYPFANKHLYQNISEGLTIERFQFVPDNKEALVVEYTFTNQLASPQTVQFEFTGHSDLRPVWLGERTNMIDGADIATWDNPHKSWIAKDSLNNWFVMFGSAQSPSQHHQNNATCQFQSLGKGCRASLVYQITIPAHSSMSLPFTIAGSYQSKEQVQGTFRDVQQNSFAYLSNKKARYEQIAQTTSLNIPDKSLEQAFRWVKYNTDWLVRNVPETGRGLCAGLPDYPWWFGVDSEYTLQGLVATGNKPLVYDAIALIHKISEKENGNGRIVHEVSSNGAVFNAGNVNETPQFVSMIWEVYQWTGDKAFLQKYFPSIQKGLQWLLDENDKDKNLLPDGFGMMEIHGMNSEMIDVAVYSQKAFADASLMAQVLGNTALANTYKSYAEKLKQKINTDFWVAESQSFADFIGTKTQALHLIDDAIIRADTLQKPWAVEELKATKNKVMALPENTKQGFVLHHNWVVNTPMETGVADPEKAQIALRTAHKFTNPFGVFVTGIDRDESAGKDESSFAPNRKIFTYTGAVMTLPTGVAAIGENNYGNANEALNYLKRMTKTFSYALPGSIYEVSPDYGMVTQAWNLYSYATPIVKQFFGIRPNAAQQQLFIKPQMPDEWNTAQLNHVPIGDNEISIDFVKTTQATTLKLSQIKADWKIRIAFPVGKFQHWEVNNTLVVPIHQGDMDIVEVTGENITLKLW
ncbi:alpha-L-rhamnosidase-related protein [Flectobacillus major]|uniref:alpha-L-rhamnosidase-related protein n=1 Tax=Flectobacillus major TaxID=103 RepID=UPI0003FC2EE1|nr:family 78 glycoside hydrolase catalytic domain [Flectobacillus major]